MQPLTNLEILHRQITSLMEDPNTVKRKDETVQTQSSSFSEMRIRVKYIGNYLYYVSLSVDYAYDKLAGTTFTLSIDQVATVVTSDVIATLNDNAIRSLQSHVLTLTENIRKLV